MKIDQQPEQYNETIMIKTVMDSYAQYYESVVNINDPIIVLSGVSGVGKSTLLNLLSQQTNIGIIRNYVTRAKRVGEDDTQAIFGNEEDLQSHMNKGKVLVCQTWPANGKKYSLLTEEIERPEGKIRILQTTAFGNILKAQNPEKVLNIWLVLKDMDRLKARLTGRSSEDTNEVEKRLKLAFIEQLYIIENQQDLLNSGKIDLIINVGGKSIEEVYSEFTSVLNSFSFVPSKKEFFYK